MTYSSSLVHKWTRILLIDAKQFAHLWIYTTGNKDFGVFCNFPFLTLMTTVKFNWKYSMEWFASSSTYCEVG